MAIFASCLSDFIGFFLLFLSVFTEFKISKYFWSYGSSKFGVRMQFLCGSAPLNAQYFIKVIFYLLFCY